MAANFPNITISIAHNRDGSDATGELNTLSIGFGLFASWVFTAVYGASTIFGPSPSIEGFPAVSDDLASALTFAFLCTSAVVLLLIGITNQLLLRFYVSKRALVSSAVLACAGTLLMMAAPLGGVAVAVVSGVCMGFGSSIMTALWGTAYARYEFTTIILNATISIVVGVAVFLALTHWVIPPFSGVITAAIPAFGALLLWKLTPVPYYVREEIPIFHPLSIRKTAFFVRFGIPVLVLGFSLGTVRKIALSNVLPATDLTSQLIVGAAACVSVLVIVATVAASRDESHWDSIFRVVIPIVAGAIFCVPLLDGEFHSLACFVIVGGFICFEALVWIFFSDLSQEFRLSPIYVFGIGRGMIFIGYIAANSFFDMPLSGVSLDPLLSTDDSFLLMLVLVIGYALLPRKRDIRRLIAPIHPEQDNTDHIREKVVSRASETQADSASLDPDGQPNGADPEESIHVKGRFHTRCEEIADRYLLSRRETEVMFLLAKGHNAAYIQDKLCISKSTAKTHINHIYRKLDIHTQQELLNMMEEPEPEPVAVGLGAKLTSVSRHMKAPVAKKK
ncbi:MAG: hypothetical protein IJO87_03875 [Eggerthellaceae bacterium]|nr:hypothetical protein [Eggerthellaceae bacterium]